MHDLLVEVKLIAELVEQVRALAVLFLDHTSVKLVSTGNWAVLTLLRGGVLLVQRQRCVIRLQVIHVAIDLEVNLLLLQVRT